MLIITIRTEITVYSTDLSLTMSASVSLTTPLCSLLCWAAELKLTCWLSLEKPDLK